MDLRLEISIKVYYFKGTKNTEESFSDKFGVAQNPFAT